MTPKKKKTVLTDEWVKLNNTLRNATEDKCLHLLKLEKRFKKRKQYMLRIHSRLNRVRRNRERKELGK